MTHHCTDENAPPALSIGIFAWNEERSIARTLASLFDQSLFANLKQQGIRAEIMVVANGCTDGTCAIAEQVFAEQKRLHPSADAFTTRVVNLPERGKFNAWNRYVHSLSARSARHLFLMDADIFLRLPDTLWNMLVLLESHPQAHIAVDRPRKDIEFKSKRSWRDRLSLSAARVTSAATAQLCAQLYCIRAECVRNIYLPRDLGACEDGFIKVLACTDFLEHEVWPARLQTAAGAEHMFEAYTSPRAIIKNQKRQIMGQTMVHLVVDRYLRSLPLSGRQHLADTLRAKDQSDPGWLKQLLAKHLRETRFFWRLHPGLLSQRFRNLARLSFGRRAACFPAAALASGAALLASLLAWRALKGGCTDYWPRAPRSESDDGGSGAVARPALARTQ